MQRGTKKAKTERGDYAWGPNFSAGGGLGAMPYCVPEPHSESEPEAGSVTFRVLQNCPDQAGKEPDAQTLVWLMGVKNVFSRQLPKMPKEYIVRLVLDRNHKSIAVIKDNVVFGAICYRPWYSQKFAEIAFCAISSTEQVRGFGTRLMNHTKEYAKKEGLDHFLTYADNYAIGYFKKQGFAKQISMPLERWKGFIKDYEGGTLMECEILKEVDYTALRQTIRDQKAAVHKEIAKVSKSYVVHAGLTAFSKAGVVHVPYTNIKGVAEAGYQPGAQGRSLNVIKGGGSAGGNAADALGTRAANPFEFQMAASGDPQAAKELQLYLQGVFDQIMKHSSAWPFLEPVDVDEVPDYRKVVRDPLCLKDVQDRLSTLQFYRTKDIFLADLKRITANCRKYNPPETNYYVASDALEAFFVKKLT